MTKNQIKKRVGDVALGLKPALTLYGELKQLKDEVESAIKKIMPDVIDEASKNEKTFTFSGFTFEQRTGGPVYDFKEVPGWEEAKASLQLIEHMSKEAYKMYANKVDLVTPDGEVVPLPKVTYKSDSLIVKKS